MDSATELLGRYYDISGRVIRGERIGHVLGFPTANLEIDNPHKLIPATGAYAVRVSLGERIFGGMMNIGMRPTVGGRKMTLEVHIFDFNEEIYGDTLKVEFVARIRDEKPFPDIESLKAQLEIDQVSARNQLSDIT
jgi:riboflavin kinase/FMN adenylyltransferase